MSRVLKNDMKDLWLVQKLLYKTVVVRGRGLVTTGQSVQLQVGGCRAGSLVYGLIRWGEEVADALLRQLAVLVVVEGLAWELAEEGWAQCATAAADHGRRTDEALCAAAPRWTTEPMWEFTQWQNA